MKEQNCGNCKYAKDVLKGMTVHICGNIEAEEYGLQVPSEYVCELYEERGDFDRMV